MHELKYVLLISVLVSMGFACLAQSPLARSVNITGKNIELRDALYQLSVESDVNISFVDNLIPDKVFPTLDIQRKPLAEVLEALLEGTDLSYELIGSQIVIVQRPVDEIQKYTISGYIRDAESGEFLIGANIIEFETGRGTSSNLYGFYSITLPAGHHILTYSYLGYERVYKEIFLQQDIGLDISMNTHLTMPTVIVQDQDEDVQDIKHRISTDPIPIQKIKKLPGLGGEPDLIRGSYLLPGVQTGADGVGGMHIRGGNSDQTLVLLDGVPVYNPYHTAGLYSIFNTAAVRSADLIKGAQPARYGGRLSSVMDVRTREGNVKEFEGDASIGIIAAKATLEGPIVPDKTGFFLSFRRSVVDPWIKQLFRYVNQREDQVGFTTYRYLDFNAKLHHTFSDKDRIYLSFYGGGDDYHEEIERDFDFGDFRFDDEFQRDFNWGNKIGALRWNHLFGSKLFANTTVTFSRFEFSSFDFSEYITIQNTQPDIRSFDILEYTSTIEDKSIKVDFDYIPSPSHYIKFGASYIDHQFGPGIVAANEQSMLDTLIIFDESTNLSDSLREKTNINAREYAVYLEDEMNIGQNVLLNLGIRASAFDVQENYYFAIEPRLNTTYFLSNNLAVKGAFGLSTQYLHLLTNSGLGLPNDLWVPSTAKIDPQRAWQMSLGLDYSVDNQFGLSVEGYYKKMNHLITYEEGASFLVGSGILNNGLINAINWEDRVTKGEGWAYGVELLASKNVGKTTGWLSYALSWSERKFEEVNFGRRYPFKFDRRINARLVLLHEMNPSLTLSFMWTYGSGNPITIAATQYTHSYFPFFINQSVLNFGSKNDYRMEDYHRLDIGVQYQSVKDWGTQTVTAGFYNTYNRSNPFFYTIEEEPFNPSEKRFLKVTLLPILPSLQYRVEF